MQVESTEPTKGNPRMTLDDPCLSIRVDVNCLLHGLMSARGTLDGL